MSNMDSLLAANPAAPLGIVVANAIAARNSHAFDAFAAREIPGSSAEVLRLAEPVHLPSAAATELVRIRSRFLDRDDAHLSAEAFGDLCRALYDGLGEDLTLHLVKLGGEFGHYAGHAFLSYALPDIFGAIPRRVMHIVESRTRCVFSCMRACDSSLPQLFKCCAGCSKDVAPSYLDGANVMRKICPDFALPQFLDLSLGREAVSITPTVLCQRVPTSNIGGSRAKRFVKTPAEVLQLTLDDGEVAYAKINCDVWDATRASKNIREKFMITTKLKGAKHRSEAFMKAKAVDPGMPEQSCELPADLHRLPICPAFYETTPAPLRRCAFCEREFLGADTICKACSPGTTILRYRPILSNDKYSYAAVMSPSTHSQLKIIRDVEDNLGVQAWDNLQQFETYRGSEEFTPPRGRSARDFIRQLRETRAINELMRPKTAPPPPPCDDPPPLVDFLVANEMSMLAELLCDESSQSAKRPKLPEPELISNLPFEMGISYLEDPFSVFVY